MSDAQENPGPARNRIRIRALGELTVTVDGREVPLGGTKQRMTFALLACRPNTRVSVDMLVEAVWAGDPPASARKNLQAYISALRKLLPTEDGRGRLAHHGGGYELKVSADELDLLRYEELVRSGRQAVRLGSVGQGAQALGQALELWRGPLMSGLHDSQVIRDEAARHATRRVAVYEDWAEAELELGNSAQVADILAEVVSEHPLRERLRAAQMTALHRVGRKTEALASYDDIRQLLARDLGLGAGPALEAVRDVVLADADERTPQVPESRRTVLPTDLPDFTGRERQVRQLRDALDQDGALVLVNGPLGVGKTALAVHVAHLLRQQFPDGVLYVRLSRDDCSARPVSSVLAELCRAAGLTELLPADDQVAAAMWRSRIAERRMLVLLDDAPGEASVSPLLPGTGRTAVVITSKSTLGGLGPVSRIMLGPFRSNEAVALLTKITADERLAGDPVSARRIADALDGLPLALRVAGTRLAMFQHLAPQEYAARLEESTSLLDELTTGGFSVRDRLVAWWRTLPPALEEVLVRLGSLPGRHLTRVDAAAALRCVEHRAEHTLEGLVELGLMRVRTGPAPEHPARYEMPLLTRIAAAQQRNAVAAFRPCDRHRAVRRRRHVSTKLIRPTGFDDAITDF